METVLDLIITPDLFVFPEGNFPWIALPRTIFLFIFSRIDYLRTKDQCYITGWGYTGQGSAGISNKIEVLEFVSRTLI